jgi:tRNA (cytidine/uridine-2'-O-)-methyltransferase
MSTRPLPSGFAVQPPQPSWGTADDLDLHVVLHEPEIPGNTGSIGRLCAGTNIWLHLVEPLGFKLEDRYLKRAGLDYWPNVKLCVHKDLAAVEAIFPRERMNLFTTRTTRRYTDVTYTPGSVLVFGKETAGLPAEVVERYEDRLVTLPMVPGSIRSLNLANACSVAAYEALRQLAFAPLER